MSEFEFTDAEDLSCVADVLGDALAVCMDLCDEPLGRLQCALRLLDRPIVRKWLTQIASDGGPDGEAARQLRRHLSWGIPLTAPEELRKITRMLRTLFRSAAERARERKIEEIINA